MLLSPLQTPCQVQCLVVLQPRHSRTTTISRWEVREGHGLVALLLAADKPAWLDVQELGSWQLTPPTSWVAVTLEQLEYLLELYELHPPAEPLNKVR